MQKINRRQTTFYSAWLVPVDGAAGFGAEAAKGVLGGGAASGGAIGGGLAYTSAIFAGWEFGGSIGCFITCANDPCSY